MMRLYRIDKGGIDIWRLSGVVGPGDARVLVRNLKESGRFYRGCHVLDFENVVHVDYRAFGILEHLIPDTAKVVISGLSDYLLDIFALVREGDCIPVYPDWRRALDFLLIEYGKLTAPAGAGAIGQQ